MLRTNRLRRRRKVINWDVAFNHFLRLLILMVAASVVAQAAIHHAQEVMR